jgi:DsbC/DsbD-like thiol-disulfide interchange protein
MPSRDRSKIRFADGPAAGMSAWVHPHDVIGRVMVFVEAGSAIILDDTAALDDALMQRANGHWRTYWRWPDEDGLPTYRVTISPEFLARLGPPPASG